MPFWLSAAVLAAFLFAYPAVAGHAQCNDHEVVVEQLAAKYGERVTAMGLNSAGAVIEVFVSKAGSWTITVTMPDGPTCLVSAGEGWETLSEPDPESARRRNPA